MSHEIAPTTGLPRNHPLTSRNIDRRTSSTTPDLPKAEPFLSIPAVLGWAGGIGVGLGALFLRSKGAGWSPGALGSGAWKGAALGAGLGAALIGIDRVTGGEVKRQLDLVGLDRRAQLWFVISNPTKPWIASMGLGVAGDARTAQYQLFGRAEPLDGAQDAFRHAYAAALFSLRAMRDHGVEAPEAHQLALEAGAAHETDGQDNNDEHSRSMDTFNNTVGTEVVADGRAATGEASDARGFVTEEALRSRVLAALAAGELRIVDRTGSEPSTRATSFADLPADRSR